MTNDTYSQCTLHVEVLHDGTWVEMPGFAKNEDEFVDFKRGYEKLKEVASVRATRRTVSTTVECEDMDMDEA